MLNSCTNSEDKILIMAKLMKKERKKVKQMKLALMEEIDRHTKSKSLLVKAREELTACVEDEKAKDAKIVKAHSSYTEIYDAFQKLQSEREDLIANKAKPESP
jgi:hypothetical protein